MSFLIGAWKLLGPFGTAGLVGILALSVMLGISKGETRHWKKQSGQYETLYHDTHDTLTKQVASTRQAALDARASDQANLKRVVASQATINERTAHDYEARLVAARAAAQRLHGGTPGAAADPCTGGAKDVPRVPATACVAAAAAREDRLSNGDALVATEQAIQLDELIKWVRAQHDVQP